MGKVIHFKNSTDRLNFVRGKHTEIKPIEVKVEEKPKKTAKKPRSRKKKAEEEK